MNSTLIGMPGSGKSFVGREIASRLGFNFIETDKKFIAKCKTITIDSILSSDEKKQFIREYDDKYSNSIIMHNNNLFYILK